jgi:hypothetical protein
MMTRQLTVAQADVIEDWIHDLESGVFRQGKNFLYKDGEMCCLGVLSEKCAVPRRQTIHGIGVFHYAPEIESESFPPEEWFEE